MHRIDRKRRRNLLLAIAAAAIAAGAIVASVSAHGGPRHGGSPRARAARTRAELSSTRAHAPGERAIAARYLGLTRAQLSSKLRSGRTLAQIADATSGRSAAGLIDALVNASQQAHAPDVRSRVALAVDGLRTSADRSTAAGYLEVSVAKLRQELRSGRSLAQIAGATSGKSATGLIDALVGAREAQLKAAVAAGTLESAMADRYLSNLRARVTREVDRTRRAPAR